MLEPRGRRWTLRDKKSDLLLCAAILVGGAFFVTVVLTAVEDGLAPMDAVLLYTLYALALPLGLAALALATRSLDEHSTSPGHRGRLVQLSDVASGSSVRTTRSAAARVPSAAKSLRSWSAQTSHHGA